MKSGNSQRVIAMMPLFALLAGCVNTTILNDVPHCERLISPDLKARVEPAPLPEARQLPDGHDDAQPWQEGFAIQTTRLGDANGRTETVDFIYRNCLDMHREQLQRSKRGFFARLFG